MYIVHVYCLRLFVVVYTLFCLCCVFVIVLTFIANMDKFKAF